MDLINILFAKALNKEDATKEYVNEAIKALKGEVSADLDTLEELSRALGNDPDFFLTVKNEFDSFKTELVTGEDAITENTRFAIGIAEQSLEVPSMEEFNQLKDEKLSEPADGLAVGKYFRVAAIDENGHAVLEAVEAKDVGVQDVQINNESIIADGVANIKAKGYGIGFNKSGLYLASATFSQVAGRVNSNVPITPTNYDYAVKLAMCDGKGAAWTADEQAAARERMGIPGDYELIADVTTEEETEQLYIDKDNNGTDLMLVKAIMFIELPKYEGDLSILYIKTCFYAMNEAGRSKEFSSANTLFSKAYKTYSRTEIDFAGGILSANQYGIQSSKLSSSNFGSNFGYDYDYSGTLLYANKIGYERYNANSPIIPAGTRVKLYGVRA